MKDLLTRIRRECDVVVTVADARNPETFFNYRPYREQKVIQVINKIDLCTENELEDLRKNYKNAIFMSCRTRKGKGYLLHTLIRYAKERGHLVRVGIVGVPNVGKSSIINMLRGKRSLRTSPTPGETKGIQWIKIHKDILLYDSPGVFIRNRDEQVLAKAATISAEKMNDPERAAVSLLEHLMKSKGKEYIASHYDISIEDEDDVYTIIEKIARRNGMLLKGGELDLDRAAKRIIHEWQQGKI